LEIKLTIPGDFMPDSSLTVKVQMGILKPAHEIFDAIVSPDKLNKYFVTSGSGRMESGKTITWTWEDYEVEHQIKVGKVEKDKLVSFMWDGSGVECLVVITLELKSENKTLVKIVETEWPLDTKGAARCMGQVEGWTHFLCCLKAYLEHNIDLRVGGGIK
jgi:uncharacterized protein YndB with AHSA1/START domain